VKLAPLFSLAFFSTRRCAKAVACPENILTPQIGLPEESYLIFAGLTQNHEET
jgi:hypothetical protein